MKPHIIAVFAFLLATITAPARGVTFGWEVMQDGGLKYIVQVEPGLVDAFRDAGGFQSFIPPDVPKFACIQLKIGTDKLPNEGTLPPPAEPSTPSPAAAQTDPMVSAPSSTKPNDALDGAQPADFQTPEGAKPIGDHPFKSAYSKQEPPLPPLLQSNTQSNTQIEQDPAPPDNADDQKEPRKTETEKPVINDSETSHPWMPLMLALVALFASVGANAYLMWIHQSLRANYRAVVARLKGNAFAA